MWNDTKSILLSRISVLLFMFLLVATDVSAPWLIPLTFSGVVKPGWDFWFYVTLYTGTIPAALLLITLYRLLRRIEKGEVFVQKNVDGLRFISWCCFAGALVSVVSVIYYVPWVMVTGRGRVHGPHRPRRKKRLCKSCGAAGRRGSHDIGGAGWQ